jgi:uncharacterized protein (TIGR02646 family)
MKKLTRHAGPPFLAQFIHGRDNWSVISQNNLTDDIWAHINQMQNGFCAYCECQLVEDNKKRHIEHFFQKGKTSAVTFDWTNLFGSCNHSKRCGKHKDHDTNAKLIDLNAVCKPDIDDASDFILFLTDGKVRPRSTLEQDELKVAENTIDVFNLDGDSTLINSRLHKIKGELPLVKEYWEVLVNDVNGDMQELLDDELQSALDRIGNYEYSTALRHAWLHNEEY